MLLFRADKTDFEVGDVITTAGHYFDKFPENTKLLEQRLEDFRPNDKPRRIDCFFLFESLDLAKRHWGNTVSEIRCQYIILARKDELTSRQESSGKMYR